MADLSKIKLNGDVYNFKDAYAREKLVLATQATNGLLSAADKRVIDGLNPNIVTTLSNLNTDQLEIINAKEENLVDMTITVEPTIASQIRTDNLLDVHGEITPGFYISGTGVLSTNANDTLGDFIPVSPGDDIYYTGIIGPTSSSSINRRLHVYKSDKTWIKQLSFAGSLHEGDHWSTHGVVPSNGAYVRVSWGSNDTHVMISVGAPQNYEPYYVTPFTASGSASFKVSTTSDPEEATTYTYTVPTAAGNQYGFLYNPITGKLTQITGHIASYNGETLPGDWVSDRDDPAEDETPSTGAEVVYWLAEEDYVEYDGTPITVPLNYHTNFFFIDDGKLQELKYYAETLAVDHLTVYNGMTFNGINVLGEDFQNLKNIDSLLSTKADIDSPALTGSPISTAPGRTDASRRIATAGFVQNLWNNVAPVEVTYKASRNYAVGDYVYILGTLYKVTVTVPQNGTLTVGTNIVATTVMDEMESQGSSDSTFIINITKTNNTYSADKTYNEILTAYNNNKTLLVRYGQNCYFLYRILDTSIQFKCILNSQNKVSYRSRFDPNAWCIEQEIITISNTGTVDHDTNQFFDSHVDNNDYIEICDANGDSFTNPDSLVVNTPITVSSEFYPTYNYIPIFYENSKVRVGSISDGSDTFFMQDGDSILCETYDLNKYTVSKQLVVDPQGYEDSYFRITHIGIFRTLSMRSNSPVLKTITLNLSYPENDGIYGNVDITASYEEISL